MLPMPLTALCPKGRLTSSVYARVTPLEGYGRSKPQPAVLATSYETHPICEMFTGESLMRTGLISNDARR